MNRIAMTISIALLALGCASSQRPPDLLQPQVEIRQIDGASEVGVTRNIVGGTPVKLQIAVMNPSQETIEVELVEIGSIGLGGFTVPTTKRPINKTVRPDQFEIFDFWTAAYAEGSVAGTGSPVTLRLTVYFSSELGKFREIYTQTINTSKRPRSDPQ